jgi:arylsulfatase A-like enzyme
MIRSPLSTATATLAALGLAVASVFGPATDHVAAQPAAPPESAAAAVADRPNILFIFTDDHGAHAISAYGTQINQTPNIDRLAREGMLFRNAFVTNSICGPSRAAILTGKFSHLNGVFGNDQVFDGTQVTFPRLLQDGGYQTAFIGKWHLFSDPTGFDHWSILISGYGAQQGFYYNPPMRMGGSGIDQPSEVRHTGYATNIVTDQAIEWLSDQRDPNKPFMLMVQHKAPHRNWKPGPDHLTMYDDVEIPEPDNLFDDWQTRSDAARTQEMTIAHHLNPHDLKLSGPDRHLTPEQADQWNAAYEPKNQAMRAANLAGDDRTRWNYQRYIKDYLRTIASVDDNIGRMLEYLDESGLADNTIVIYTSDQGFFLGDHGWYDKRFMYEESLQIPLIVRWPGVIEPGSENERLVQNLDFAQTFLDMAGVEADESMQGRSIVPLMRGEDPDWRNAVYYHYYEWPYVHMVHQHYGARTDRYKLIHFYGLDQWELFDLEKDPREMNNVYDDPEYAQIVHEMTAEIERLQEQYHLDRPRHAEQLVRNPEMAERAENIELENVLRVDRPAAIPHHPDIAAERADPTASPLTIGAWAVPHAPNGVILSHGGEQFGYALFLFDGRPYFAIRNRGRLIEAIGDEPLAMNQPVHLAARLMETGQMQLFVNGERIRSVMGQLLEQAPREGITIGADPDTTVGGYRTPMLFEGELRDVRIYWGNPDDEQVQQWAQQRP